MLFPLNPEFVLDLKLVINLVSVAAHSAPVLATGMPIITIGHPITNQKD